MASLCFQALWLAVLLGILEGVWLPLRAGHYSIVVKRHPARISGVQPPTSFYRPPVARPLLVPRTILYGYPKQVTNLFIVMNFHHCSFDKALHNYVILEGSCLVKG